MGKEMKARKKTEDSKDVFEKAAASMLVAVPAGALIGSRIANRLASRAKLAEERDALQRLRASGRNFASPEDEALLQRSSARSDAGALYGGFIGGAGAAGYMSGGRPPWDHRKNRRR